MSGAATEMYLGGSGVMSVELPAGMNGIFGITSASTGFLLAFPAILPAIPGTI